MSVPRHPVSGSSVEDAEERFRISAELLAVRLRWFSIVVIPVLAHLSGQPVSSPWFEVLMLTAVGYNFAVARSLAGGRRGPVLSVGTALQDSAYLALGSWLSGGLDSPLTMFGYLAMISVCMRLPTRAALGVALVYTAWFSALASLEGRLGGMLLVRIAFLFLVPVFVVPLVREARAHFAEVLAGHSAQRGLLRRLLRLEEEERRRIASELHDRGGGALFSLLHGLRRLRDLVNADGTAAAEIDRLTGVVEASVHDLRALLADLRPRLLDDLGLAEALRDLLARERALSGLAVSFEVETDASPEGQSALALYRVAQEALTNIRRHAEARTAVVRLGQQNGCWQLSIEDDGVGLQGRPGLGLRTMRERVEALGGRLEVASPGSGGTFVRAELPRHESGVHDVDSGLSR